MALNPVYFASSIIGGLGLFVVWLWMRQVRHWSFPVRRRSFHYDRVTEAVEGLADRGPSGKTDEGERAEAAAAEGEAKEEAEEEAEPERPAPEPKRPSSLWDRMKLHLYTYQKRPR